MLRFLIGIARFSLSAWVGAAALFVVTGIREVQAPEIGSATRDVLVALRFPAYYLFGFVSVGTAFLAMGCSLVFAGEHKKRGIYLTCGLLIVLVTMVLDYHWVYLPLVEMVTPPGKSRPASFVDLHNASKWLNFGSILLCAIIAFVLCGIEYPKDGNRS